MPIHGSIERHPGLNWYAYTWLHRKAYRAPQKCLKVYIWNPAMAGYLQMLLQLYRTYIFPHIKTKFKWRVKEIRIDIKWISHNEEGEMWHTHAVTMKFYCKVFEMNKSFSNYFLDTLSDLGNIMQLEIMQGWYPW